MQHVISRHKEPITPFLERARDLYTEAGISTILVAGSSGAFFHIADTIIQMDCYRPVDITHAVKELCRDFPLPPADTPAFALPQSRRIMTTPDFREPQGRSRGRRPEEHSHGQRENLSLIHILPYPPHTQYLWQTWNPGNHLMESDTRIFSQN